jgi:hypothetical protein
MGRFTVAEPRTEFVDASPSAVPWASAITALPLTAEGNAPWPHFSIFVSRSLLGLLRPEPSNCILGWGTGRGCHLLL